MPRVIVPAFLAAALLVLVSAGAIRFGVPAYHTHKHNRCLANIAALEIDLGLRPAPAPTPLLQAWQTRLIASSRGYAEVTPVVRPSRPKIDQDAFARALAQMGRNEITPEQYREKLRRLGVIE